jgi:hypothetical protein
MALCKRSMGFFTEKTKPSKEGIVLKSVMDPIIKDPPRI